MRRLLALGALLAAVACGSGEVTLRAGGQTATLSELVQARALTASSWDGVRIGRDARARGTSARGLTTLKQHVDNPTQTPMKDDATVVVQP